MERNQEVTRNQAFSNEKTKNSHERKRKRLHTKAEEKHLPWLQSNNRTQVAKGLPDRLCAFCNKHHWDTDCQMYPILTRRMERLREIKAWLNCLQSGHETKDCNIRKRKCFHYKEPHNSALCPIKYKDIQNAGSTK